MPNSVVESDNRTIKHENYPGVEMNPQLLLGNVEEHYAKAWEFYRSMNSPKYICAPMVSQSEYPFRVLTRRYNCELAYTPMLHSGVIVNDKRFDRNFMTDEEDWPVFAQMCGPDIPKLVTLAKRLESYGATAIDINLGCPQNIARKGRYGSFLLEETYHVQHIVRALYDALTIPVTVKMRRLLNDLDYQRTISYAKVLQDSGASIITIHGRTRINKKDIIGQVDFNVIKSVKQHLSIPLFANGGVGSFPDAHRVLQLTSADGVMVSEALLNFPTMFMYPIRRSQLLDARYRGVGEEGLYADIDQDEPTAKPYSYDQYGEPGLRRFESLKATVDKMLQQQSESVKGANYNPVDIKNLGLTQQHIPKLLPTSSAADLHRIANLSGPNNLLLAIELLDIFLQKGQHFIQDARPHFFKMLLREFTIHTDLRFVLASSRYRVEHGIFQYLRVKQYHMWNAYKVWVRAQISHKLATEQRESLSQEEIQAIMESYDFERALLLQDTVTIKNQEEKKRMDAERLQAKAAAGSGPGAADQSKPVTSERTSTTNSSESDPSCCDQQSDAMDDPKLLTPGGGGGDDEEDMDPRTRTHQQRMAKYTISDIDPFFEHEDWTLVTIGRRPRGDKLIPLNRFNVERFQKAYQQWCLENDIIRRDDTTGELYTEQPAVPTGDNSSPDTSSMDPDMFNPRQYKERIHDTAWMHLVAGEAKDSAHSNLVKVQIDPTTFVPSLPLESAWFFERLYSQIPHYYYRHPHFKTVFHLQDEVNGPSVHKAIQRQQEEYLQKQQQPVRKYAGAAMPLPSRKDHYRDIEHQNKRQRQEAYDGGESNTNGE